MTTTESGGLTVTAGSEREIVMRRVFAAPRHLVFDAWTRPELLARWFAPWDWTMPTCEVDLRPGGRYRYVLSGPEGAEMVISGVYREIVRPERLVSTEVFVKGWDELGGAEAVMTALFEEQDGKTAWTATAVYPTAELRDIVLRSGMERGLAAGLDAMEELLRTAA